MLSQIKPALMMTMVLTVLTGIVYPLVVTGVAQTVFHNEANGSLVEHNGVVIGSSLIGQNFAKAEYFHPRPSVAGSNGYDATASGGSNLGPTNPDLAKRLQKDSAAYRAENQTLTIPADAITTSASGLDPDITPANASLQVKRVAHARRIAYSDVAALVQSHTKTRQLGVLGEPRVNVLELNLALDQQFPVRR